MDGTTAPVRETTRLHGVVARTGAQRNPLPGTGLIRPSSGPSIGRNVSGGGRFAFPISDK